MTEVDMDKWHVGKEIPIAVMFAMMLQLGGIVWFASKMDNRIDFNAAAIDRNLKDIEETETDVDKLQVAIAEQNTINARLDLTMDHMNSLLGVISRKIENMGND